MTNQVYTVGLTRTEYQTLKVLLPITFPIIQCGMEQLSEPEIERITDLARCIILNPKCLDARILTEFLYDQDYLRIRYRPLPIILFSNTMTREQQRTIPMPEYSIPVVNLHKRLDRNRNIAIRLLREATVPCWQNREAMRYNGFNDSWYLLDMETTGVDVWKDNILCIRVARMANYEITNELPPMYIRQSKPLPDEISKLTGITDDMLTQGVSLEEAVERLEELPCSNTPFVFTSEEFTSGFLNAAFLRCGKSFDRPYLAIDKLASIPFGYLMQRRALDIPLLVEPNHSNLFPDDPLEELYELTKCVFHDLSNRYDVHCPEHFDKLYAAELCE